MDNFNFQKELRRFGVHPSYASPGSFQLQPFPKCQTAETIQYERMIRKTEGFDIDMDPEKLRHVYTGGKIVPWSKPLADVTPLVSDCLEKLNKEKGTELQLVEITKCNVQFFARIWFYITLVAKDVKEEVDGDSPSKVYQLCAMRGLQDEGNTIKVFRLKPSLPCGPPPKSAEPDSLLHKDFSSLFNGSDCQKTCSWDDPSCKSHDSSSRSAWRDLLALYTDSKGHESIV